MPTTIVVGGQFGSEGKGKIVNYLSKNSQEPWVVRTGGANSGHHTEFQGQNIVVKQLPSAVNHLRAMLCIAAGCAINKSVLLDEINNCGIPKDRLLVDPRAVLIEDSDREWESSVLIDRIGSTASGTGRALTRRMLRQDDVRLAGGSKRIGDKATITNVAQVLQSAHDEGSQIIVEGTQGFGLSVLHGPYYPYATSRDVTASGFASEIGLPPNRIDDVILVIRTYPIRVGGNSGPLSNETNWEEIRKVSGAKTTEQEYTSVTNRLRRVGEFDIDLVRMACQYNGPSRIAVMGVDRCDSANRCAESIESLSVDVRRMLTWIEDECQVPIGFIGTGPNPYDLIDCQVSYASNM